MTTKQYLSQYKRMMEECRCLDVEIEELWTQLTSATSNNDGMPKGTVQDRQTKLHAIMADKLQTKQGKKQVAEEIKKQYNIDVDKRKVVLECDIKEFGTYKAEVKLYTGISAKIDVQVSEA